MKRKPTWIQDYEVTFLSNFETIQQLGLFADTNPISFDRIVKEEKEQKTMIEQLKTIEKTKRGS